MQNTFSKANWIWYCDKTTPNSYGDFIDTIEYNGGIVICHLSCDGDYTLFVNGKFASSNQYGDFEHYKIYDSIDITPFLNKGKNEIYILVWHIGMISFRYKLAQAGLLYQIENDGNHFLLDLGRESVGLLTFKVFSKTNQKMTVTWGEHIESGGGSLCHAWNAFPVLYL